MRESNLKIAIPVLLAYFFGPLGLSYTSIRGMSYIITRGFVLGLLILGVFVLIPTLIDPKNTDYYLQMYVNYILPLIGILVQFYSVCWALSVSIYKNYHKGELEKEKEIEVFKTGLDFCFSRVIYIILISLFIGCYFYAVVFFINITEDYINLILSSAVIMISSFIGILSLKERLEVILEKM